MSLTSIKTIQNGFLGLNRTNTVSNNEFVDMLNISSDSYPRLTCRKNRAQVALLSDCSALGSRDCLYWMDNDALFYNGESVLTLPQSHDKRQLINMGAYIIIWPDKVAYNTETDERISLSGYYQSNNIRIGICDEDYNWITSYDIGDEAPVHPNDGYFWVDITDGNNPVIKKFDANRNKFLKYSKCKIMIIDQTDNTENAFSDFNNNDYINISGFKNSNVPTEDMKGVYDKTNPEIINGFHKIINKGTTTFYNGKIFGNTQTITSYYAVNNSTTINLKEAITAAEAAAFTGPKKVLINGEENKILSIGVGSPAGSSITLEKAVSIPANTVIFGAGNDYSYITIDGVLKYQAITMNTITFERKIPDMDFIVECDNRLWGCSSENHEIYASKLGDPTNWSSYNGISTDSYAATIGSPGDFTGAVNYYGNVLFFKADRVHKVYGTQPSNFQISETSLRGVQKGSDLSIAIVDGILYYKNKDGICAYNGSLPQLISEPLGDTKYYDAVSGTYNSKYYVSQRDKDGNYTVFVYDTKKGLWHIEDNERFMFCATVGTELYFVLQNGAVYSVGQDMSIYGDGSAAYDIEHAIIEHTLDWYAITDELGIDLPVNKFINKIQVRASVPYGARLKVYIQIDNDGVWREMSSAESRNIKFNTYSFIPERSESYRFKYQGYGNAQIKSITLSYSEGSDINYGDI